MELELSAFEKVKDLLKKTDFGIISEDTSRPWGGFYVIDENKTTDFVRHFFPEEELTSLKITEKLSPKILMVAPGKRLSWQYHHRRAEIWRCIEGTVAVATSLTDEETHQHILHKGDKIKLQRGERHRLIGLEGWGIVAEIWQHTDTAHPSDENDIIRLQDDFGR
jgi:mannose-6-phosphate isomerase